MSFRSKISLFSGSVAAAILSIFGKSPAKPTGKDLRKMEFTSSTQRLGVRFTSKVRDVFRFRWIKKL